MPWWIPWLAGRLGLLVSLCIAIVSIGHYAIPSLTKRAVRKETNQPLTQTNTPAPIDRNPFARIARGMGKRNTSLFMEAGRCNTEEARGLLADGANPTGNISKGQFALSAAARSSLSDCRKTIVFLLESGADIHAGEDDALFAAVKDGAEPETVRLLLDHGADIHARRESIVPLAQERISECDTKPECLGRAQKVAALLEEWRGNH